MANDYQQAIKDMNNANAAFDRAVQEGRLSTHPLAVNFAGLYMYMGKDRYDIPNGKDLFKNSITRQYDV